CLGGIAVRNAILLLDHYLNLMRKEGEPFGPEMIVRAGQERMVPVMMTALTSGIALVPIALYPDTPGREILYPVATVIIGGLISSTLLDFLVRPALFSLFGRKEAERLAAEKRPMDRVSEELARELTRKDRIDSNLPEPKEGKTESTRIYPNQKKELSPMTRMNIVLCFSIILGLAAGFGALAGCHDHQEGDHMHPGDTQTETQQGGIDESGSHDHGQGAHGGALMSVGAHIADLEWLHDEQAGKVTIYLTDHDGGPVAIEVAPKINLVTAEGNKQIVCRGKDAEAGKAWCFEASDDALKTCELKGRIALKIEGKPYSVEIALHEHDHGQASGLEADMDPAHEHDDDPGHEHAEDADAGHTAEGEAGHDHDHEGEGDG
ncbi:MAG: efflux RND transporter permease subunit, partial [Planctomycetota bacterium]